jgi:hypothetical protein
VLALHCLLAHAVRLTRLRTRLAQRVNSGPLRLAQGQVLDAR